MDAIEAAARAIWARRNPNRKEAFPRAGVLREVIFADARAAIAAYRDAEIADLRAQLAAKDAEVGRLREAIAWVCGEDVEGWPPFHDYTAAGYRYRWRTVLRERLALKGERGEG